MNKPQPPEVGMKTLRCRYASLNLAAVIDRQPTDAHVL